MRNIYRIALVSVLAFSLVAAPTELMAQARRAGTSTSTSSTTSTASSSDNKSTATTASRSASTSTASRSAGSTASRSATTTSAGSTASRSSGSTASRSTSTASRSNTAAPTSSSSATTSNQVRRSTTTSSSAANANDNRRTGTTTGTTARRQTTTTGGNASTTTTTSSASRSVSPARTATTRSATTEAPATQERAATATTGRASRSNANVTSSKGLTSAPEAQERAATRSTTAARSTSANKGAVENLRDLNYSGRTAEKIRMDNERNLNRIPPRDRPHMTYDKPGSFYGAAPHFFGYRVETLPPRHRHMTYWGVDYYFYNNVYYRRYGTYYVVARPPIGVALEIALGDLAFSTVRFSYYHNVYRTFDVIDSNYRTIVEQNREIARNNALLAQQNAALALNSSRALSAYEIANTLGLVQSFANIGTEYYYEDGVFYIYNKKGRYEVIVPPAGALVNELPDDYDIIVLNGIEYYKVDDTVYRLVLVDGTPALEVLGQMYGNMAKKYNYYYN